MTEKLYLTSRELTFFATVSGVEERTGVFYVALDRTAFFPMGGGQEGDRGRLDGIPVLNTKEENGTVYHLTESPLPIGKRVWGEVDADTRFDRAQNHTGEHIVSGLVYRLFGFRNVGFHLNDTETTLDFDGVLTRADLDKIEDLANRAIEENLPVEVLYPSKEELKTLSYRSKIEIEGQVRLVSIAGYDLCACCAPHVKTTGEIGQIKLLDFIHYKGGVRIRLLCGRRALADYRKKALAVASLSASLSVKQDEVGEGVARLLLEMQNVKSSLSSLRRQYVALLADTLSPNEAGNIAVFLPDGDAEMAMPLAVACASRAPFCAVFAGNDEKGYLACLSSSTLPIGEWRDRFFTLFGVRGGGRAPLFQGKTAFSRAALEKALLTPLQ